MLGDCSIELLEETEDIQAERNWIARLDCVNSMRLEYGAGDQRDKKRQNSSRIYTAPKAQYVDESASQISAIGADRC